LALTIPPLVGFALSAGIALLAGLGQLLSLWGVLAATVVGGLVLTGTGLPGGAALFAFFIGGSVVSRLSPDPAATRLGTKGSRRDQWQVLANGGPAALGALLGPELGLWIVVTSLAVAAADTWATSTGAWSPTPPRHLFTRQPVPPGTSGGITIFGTVGALAGALTVASAAFLASGEGALFILASVTGLLGMLADSALGASWQGRFHCEACAEDTERRVHRCGGRSTLRGGFSWITNDVVNLIATGLGGVAGGLGWYWLRSP
jgi:uncharacterized protein (TIGR00297 family)